MCYTRSTSCSTRSQQAPTTTAFWGTTALTLCVTVCVQAAGLFKDIKRNRGTLFPSGSAGAQIKSKFYFLLFSLNCSSVMMSEIIMTNYCTRILDVCAHSMSQSGVARVV